MGNIFTQRLDALWVEAPMTHGALTIFPLAGVRHGELGYTPLQHAVAAKTFTITERAEEQVGALQARNTRALPVLIIGGEELIGGKQNRIINSTTLVPTGVTVLPVSCVEHHRWGGAPQSAFAPQETLYPSLRAQILQHVAASLRATGAHHADQSHIWQSISARQGAEQVDSATAAMGDLYDHRRDDLATYEAALPCPQGTVGMITAIGGRINELEIFDNPATMAALWGKFVRAAALDAIRAPVGAPVPVERAIHMVRRIHAASMETFPSPGIGHDVRFAGGGIVGAALVCQGVIVHVALFRQHTGA